MNLSFNPKFMDYNSIPRVSGGEPVMSANGGWIVQYSPRERG